MPDHVMPGGRPGGGHSCALCRGPCTRRRVAPVLSARFYSAFLGLRARRGAPRSGS